MLYNFGFVQEGRLAGCAHLGYGAELRESLNELVRDHKITAMVTLSEDPLPLTVLEEYGLRYHHQPVRDFGVPKLEEMGAAIDFVTDELARGGRVVVHCSAGYGRTGTFLACCLVAEGQSAEDAVVEVRRRRPGSIETSEQEEFVQRYAQWHKKSKGKK